MKKLSILLLSLFLFINISYADNVDFNISRSYEFEENEGEVFIGDLTVNMSGESIEGFDLHVYKNDPFIFSDKISNISLSNTDIIISDISLSIDNKIITIVLDKPITDDFIIQGLQVRLYDTGFNGAKLGLDYNQDGIVDVYTNNSISLDDDEENDDNMRPLALKNVEYELTKNENDLYTINIDWDNSPDLDSIGSFIKIFKNNSYSSILEETISKSDDSNYVYTKMNLMKDIYRIELYSRDNFYFNNNPYIITLDKDSIISDKTDTEDDIIEEDKDLVIEDNKEDEIKIIEIVKIELYKPVYKNNILYKFTPILDKYIDARVQENDIEMLNEYIEVRNNILKTLEKYEVSTKSNRNGIFIELKELFKELKQINTL